MTIYNTFFVDVLAAAVHYVYGNNGSNVICLYYTPKPHDVTQVDWHTLLTATHRTVTQAPGAQIHKQLLCWFKVNMGGAQSTPKITAQDRAILEYASHPILLYAVLK
jgi:hypothetical protein